MKSLAKNMFNSKFYKLSKIVKLKNTKNMRNAGYVAYLSWFYDFSKFEAKLTKRVDYFHQDLIGKFLILRNKTFIDGNIDNTSTLIVLNKVYIRGFNFTKTIIIGKGKIYRL